MPARTLAADSALNLNDISSHIPRILDQAQVSAANHQKNFVALHKLQSEAALQTESVRNGKGVKLTGERTFEDVFLLMVSRVLPVKKGASQADRIVKFVGGYTRFVNEKAAEVKKSEEEEEDEGNDDDEDTTASRFTARLLKFLLKGFLAKDKCVRYRVLQLVAEMVSHLGEVDEEIYMALRAALLDRIHDKEATVRVQAVIALSKLSGSEDPSEVAEGEPTVIEVLIDTLTHDSAPDVRRAALLNLPLNPTTLPHVLARTRDTDTTVRKLVYSAILEPNTMQGEAIGTTHPRALTIAQRELIVRNGLGDREPSVRAVAGALVGTWVDSITDASEGKKVEDGVVSLLKMFDLGESTIAEDVLLSVFVTRVDIFDNLEFGDSYWTELTPETAFLARVFVEHCIATKDDSRLEAALPVVTALAFRIQSAYNDLLEGIQSEEEEKIIRDVIDVDDDERVKREDERMDKEFVISEMLKLAVNLDYADEIGRRKMFQLVRDMLSQDALPENLVARCLDVLRKLSANERDLIRVVVEVVHDLRDPKDDDEEDLTKDADTETNFGETPATVKPPRVPMFSKPAAEMSPEEKARADDIDLRCLSLCIGMLERVNGTFEENSTLEGILNELIVPSVKRKEIAFREKGLISLGLCCLIARSMALKSFQLFLSQIQSNAEVLKMRVLQIVFDILMVHENEFLGKGGENAENIINFLLALLGQETSGKVQALLCMGIAKLVLSGMISDDRVLKDLIMAYLSPNTVDNQELRQCLSYFFPVYCYSSPANQRCMSMIFVDMLGQLTQVRKDLGEDEEMVSSAQVGAIFVDWTDPLKAVDVRGQAADDAVQFDMAHDIVKALFKKEEEIDKEDKKVLCQLLGKLYIPDVVDDDKLRRLKLLMLNLRSRRPLHDTTTNNAFTKFESMISKKFEKQLEDFNEEEYRKLEELKELFEFLDDMIPEDDDEVVEVDPPRRKGRKRRSESVVSTSTEGDRPDSPPASAKRGKPKSKKRQRFSTSDDESDFAADGFELLTTPPPSSAAPKRNLPKRAAAGKQKVAQVIVISSDSDEEDDEATPLPRRSAKPSSARYRTAVKEEDQLDAEIDDLLDESNSTELPHDSIMDADSEEEEDEVNGLILEEE